MQHVYDASFLHFRVHTIVRQEYCPDSSSLDHCHAFFETKARCCVAATVLTAGLSAQSRMKLSRYLPSSLGDTSKLRKMENVRGIFSVFADYKEEHPIATLAFLSSCYLLYQAFPLFMITFTGRSALFNAQMLQRCRGLNAHTPVNLDHRLQVDGDGRSVRSPVRHFMGSVQRAACSVSKLHWRLSFCGFVRTFPGSRVTHPKTLVY